MTDGTGRGSGADGRYDYIIAGGGSAGCVIASRLAEDPNVSVLLIEAGPADRHLFYRVPAGFAKMIDDRNTWGWWTTPQAHLGNKPILYPQARVLGGGSSINAQVYTRGNRRDYDAWETECGASGWGYADILPYFRKAEDNDTFSDAYHGVGGPLGVSQPVNPLPISRAFIRAAQEAGIPYTADFNGERQTGFGLYQTTIRNSERSSTSRAYLRDTGRRPNLTLMTGRRIRRLLIDGNRADGVEFTAVGGSSVETAFAEREVIVTSGAIGSPSLLMRSGIGGRKSLADANIDVAVEVPGVGENLQDHLGMYVIAECTGDFTYDKHASLPRMAMSGLQYLATGSGPAASNLCEAGGFAPTYGNDDWPDAQFHVVLGASINDHSYRMEHCGVTINSAYMRPKSVGSVRLQSADPSTPPLIDPNFLDHPEDRERSIAAFRLSREILGQPSLSKYIKQETLPGRSVQTDEDILREAPKFAKTEYHPVGTCRMGADDLSVVDPANLKVRGLANLRVCDSSIMPRVISSNTNAITIAIAERAADFIKAAG